MGFRIVFNENNVAEEEHRVYRSQTSMTGLTVAQLPAPYRVLAPDETLFDDGEVTPGQTYYYRIGAVTAGGTVEAVSDELVLVADSGGAPVIPLDGLVALYSMNLVQGTTLLEASRTHDGVINNGPVTPILQEPGLFEKCLKFTRGQDTVGDTNQHINVASVWDAFPAAGLPFTLSAFVRMDGQLAYQHDLVDVGNGGDGSNMGGFRLSFFNGGFQTQLLEGSTRHTLMASGVSVVVGTWYHLAATYDGTQLEIYVDGVSRGTLTANWALQVYRPAILAAQPPDASNPSGDVTVPLNGALDYVSIHNRALSAAEIQTIASSMGA